MVLAWDKLRGRLDRGRSSGLEVVMGLRSMLRRVLDAFGCHWRRNWGIRPKYAMTLQRDIKTVPRFGVRLISHLLPAADVELIRWNDWLTLDKVAVVIAEFADFTGLPCR